MIGYETVFITHPDLEEADLKKSLKKFKDIIKKGKGHIWYLQGTGAILDELQTQFRYSDEVLRFQTVKVDDLDQEAGFFSEMLKAQQKTAPAESGETNSEEAETSSAKEETPENASAESAEESPKEDQAADQSEAAETENTEA